jgi:diazepam-binding inhibitor (GABA receptor modulating acyl-CoA-binding protein)
MESADFDKAAAVIGKAKDIPELKSALNDDILLELYGLFKVANVGECNTERPGGLFNAKEKAKWDAWKKASDEGTDQEAAKAKYVDIVAGLYPKENW